MLNENDFSEIGKRMYGLEAEPPERGWEKIAGGLKNGGKGNFFSRHWWKSLFLLIPTLLYFANEQGLLSTGSLSAGLAVNTESSVKPSANTDLSATPDIADSATLLKQNRPSVQSTPKNPAREKESSTSKSTISKKPTNNASVNFTEGKSRAEESIAAAFPLSIEGSPARTRAPVAGLFDNESPSEETGSTESQGWSEVARAGTPLNRTDSSGSNTLSKNDAAIKDGYASDSTSAVSELDERAVASVVTSLNGSAEREKSALETGTSTDASTEGTMEDGKPAEAEKEKEKEDDDEGEATHTWRVTALFTPHFVRKSVRPVENDDVFITNLERKKAFDRAGFGLAIGIGKQIRQNLFVDVQATFSSQREHFSWTYTTGDVDTLIARQESNGAVRVVPVYNSSSAGIQSKLNYAGVRVGGTYYFWSKPRRRFNVSALAGINALVYSNVRENISGNWIELKQDDLAKTMYTFTFSAGYNVRLGASWEAQLNPSITYYAGKESAYQQLRNLNQRSYGLTLLMTRYF